MSNYLYYDYAHSCVCSVSTQIKRIFTSSLKRYLNFLCMQNGSTLQGRISAYRHCMHTKKYTPICVNSDVIFFPITSTKDDQCIYVNYQEIHHIQYKEKTCTITFNDHTCLTCYYPHRIQNTILHIQSYLLLF